MAFSLFVNSLSFGVILLSICASLFIWLARLVYTKRSRMRGLPGPPHHWFWGHLKVMGEIRANYPLDLHPHVYPVLIREKYALGPVFYLDFWPFGPQALIVADPDLALQLQLRPKHESVTSYMAHLTGENNLVSMHGPEWKTWRAIFNPGFSAAHLSTLVPAVLEDGEVFCEILAEHARAGDVFRLEEAATRLTVDVIGKVTVDVKFGTQRGENVLLTAIKKQIAVLAVHGEPNPFPKLNPLRFYYQWLYARQMETYISKILRDRFRSRALSEKNNAKRKHVIDLALETYFAEERADVALKDQKLDPTFEKYAIDQIRVFIFAGHDTTSSIICYVLHMLETHPDALAKVIAEHDQVFGTDPAAAVGLMRENPHLLNKLEYTLAVIKEVLRLFPAASSIRKGDRNLYIRDPDTGAQLPTDDFMVWMLHLALHRAPAYWDSPNDFRPERFLSPSLSTLTEGVWRPFERGPRACIGQELALLEVKIITVMVLRRFVVKAAYKEVAKLEGDRQGWPKGGSEAQNVWGEVAYQTLRGTAKPRQGMPSRVVFR